MPNYAIKSDELVSQDVEETCKQFSNNVIQYSIQVEGIIARLFECEGELQSKTPMSELQSASFNQVLDEYSQHERFISEFCEYSHTVMKCKEEGQEMRDNFDLYSDEDRDEIGIQIDTMEVCYEKLKILATDRLQSLQSILKERQQVKIERFEEWLSSMESKIAVSTNIGPDFEAIKRQLRDLSDLKVELEQKQDFLNFMSNVIIFDEVDSESLQLRSRSCASLDDRLERMNHRWIVICQYVEQRETKLKKASTIWKLLDLEGPQLLNWFRRIQKNLEELSTAAKSASDLQLDDVFLSKLVSRSEKIDQDIKGKQSFYTSLESRVMVEINDFDDPCSMLVIELEKKLEDLRDCWNGILNRKRMLDFTIQALVSSDLKNESVDATLVPQTSASENRLQQTGHKVQSTESFNLDTNPIIVQLNGASNENSSSSGTDARDLSSQVDETNPEPRALDNSISSDSKSFICESNHDRNLYNNNDSQDDFSSTSMTTSLPTNPILMNTSETRKDLIPAELLDSKVIETQPNWCTKGISMDGTEPHYCRVEELKHSIETFSMWLKQVETSLGVDTSLDAIVNAESIQASQCWLKLDAHQKLLLLIDVEKQIVTTCQDEFDCLILQGEQIIEDLMPELDGNECDINPKQILSDLEIRYSTVKKTLGQHKRELMDTDHWFRLLKTLKDESEKIIHTMSSVVPESNIGVDLITLAQQQDELMHIKADFEDSIMIHSSIEESRLFLKFCDTLQQQLDMLSQKSTSLEILSVSEDQLGRPQSCNRILTALLRDIWKPMKALREDIKNQLDRLNVHYSDLLQLIEERLVRLEEVHREIHSLQFQMQDLAVKLQVTEILRSSWSPLDDLTVEQLAEQLEDLRVFGERLGEVESAYKALECTYDWMIKSNVPLSHQNISRIDELGAIWDMIRESVQERQKQIDQALAPETAEPQQEVPTPATSSPKLEATRKRSRLVPKALVRLSRLVRGKRYAPDSRPTAT